MQPLIIDVDTFNLKYTLECGQCFRWQKISNQEYIGIIKDRVLRIVQEGNKLKVYSNKIENLEEVVRNYFDLNTDYKKIEADIVKVDNNVKKAVNNTTGLRILKQDFLEMLLSYIISANNNIPRISKSVNLISKRYGKKVIFENKEYYLFPTLDELRNVTKDEYRECMVGFRDKYLYETVNKLIFDIENNKLNIENLYNYDTKELESYLLDFKGVGQKVCDCILLFAFSRFEVFPIDVWVERVMSVLYFKSSNKILKKKDILEYAKNNFANYSGIIQQHLFYNMREKMIEIN